MLREAIIRGDIAAFGLVLAISGMVLGAVALSGAGAVPGVVALGLIPSGVALILWSRRQYGRLLEGVVRSFDGHEVGPSPVGWVSDAVWRERNRFNAELDAADELRAQIDPRVRSYARSTQGALEGPVLRPVSDAERGMASPDSADGGDPSPWGTEEALQAQLRGTPGRFIGVGIRWPVCCGGLAVLVAVGPSGPEGALVLDAEAGGVDRTQHGFRCATCGRRYRTTPAW